MATAPPLSPEDAASFYRSTIHESFNLIVAYCGSSGRQRWAQLSTDACRGVLRKVHRRLVRWNFLCSVFFLFLFRPIYLLF